ncbi:MAG: ATP phosphoribosyltransferase regulatory subunit [Pseudomonadota bacterium]
MTPEQRQQAVVDVFAEIGGDLVDPPIMMPASIPLELSGEAVRARLCVTVDGEGREIALRPDLTLAVAREEVARRRARDVGERASRYAARAFRLPAEPGDPLEFTQVGFERFGAAMGAAADAEVFSRVAAAARAGGASTAEAWFGDLAVFPAFVDALDMSDGAAGALKRAFRQAGGVKALLRAEEGAARHGLAGRLDGASWDEAEAVVRDVMAISGIQPVGARGLDEIVERLLAQAADAGAGRIPAEARRSLDAVLDVEVEIAAAADALSAIAAEAALTGLDDVLQALQTRMDAAAAEAGAWLGPARFGTPFGRRFNYYDGFVFELFAPKAPWTKPFGSGGRYDQLLSDLSEGDVSATAVGGIVRPDRIEGGAR